MNEQQFQELLEEKGITLSSKQLQQFQTYYEILVEWNEKMNLTAITDKEEVYEKHFFDSIMAAFSFDFSSDYHICDVGAGAGFPSLPIKICFPHLNITIVDSLNKRIGFLEHLSSKLQLENVSFYHDRAELFGKNKDHREKYDVVTARAVARLSVLGELCLPLVKTNGYFVALKGPNVEDELDTGKQAIKLLGGEVVKRDTLTLPAEKSERNIVTIKKIKTTPKKYPRKPGTPNKNPL
ncbi:16S rRNA (guanine(527)-N(7))-methyltransferase RsmG [Bacillus hwajinpoensis]|jgi:16S rRNA (guanine527-N7)-methyltransferase|uniref:Ribosomal RNA small subunit methyltransferase G n=1 Tax=Guptibacillus hwajinpoensis TaxID=208199 RepID=A0A845ESB0_9BACL|nr:MULTISPECIES: 16S rRNA (guanine(527)-N(7))-methyltransferase RsmG [Bacillaceae]MYL62619.1 16S rRNA (guanine(527)-N(7))-methyltransferase RsmG [Pseudalkalibacillus hwajinpoensis]QHA94052.1 16S rRNA (guanine(527)-N(7))-methyltransferase RsmG [Bacillus sp. N1-1]